ncbi:DNA gyrase inhibitor YacG [Methylobacterium mesophilicum SR1.6/6]|uniref:DNA gyrase inhibitor YacG n=1 Tax=Methylobacterium mesophilicum SR1.6/6 TaxID=908290 RepID=A0A6B9FGC3_9HYPH|nr:DNA gyrase inhibitor YacG [Methylobacterium mesophilicum]QGY01790.1 DNA gyrase inhibitor YacG [Methylobacterium mesophilicum SR1.6/6]
MKRVLRAACPICRRPAELEYRPFCSQRCADVDLGRWLNERYALPEEIDSDEPPRDEDSQR